MQKYRVLLKVKSCHKPGDIVPQSDHFAPSSNYGLKALVEELQEQGVSEQQLLRAAGVRSIAGQLTKPQRFAIVKSACELARQPDTALAAGTRQRVHHLGAYGFALATSQTLGDAMTFGRQYLELAGALLHATYRQDGAVGILSSSNPHALGRFLPFVAEFWRSSLVTLLGQILGAPFPTRKMTFPYATPPNRACYRDYFDCQVEFESDSMELHFDAAVLAQPCPNASEVTTGICREFCESVIGGDTGDSPLQRQLKSFILGNTRRRCTADEAALATGLSKRTLFRRLSEEGKNFQGLLDETRAALASEYLANTRLPVSEVAERCGFRDEANFRKAFARWQGLSPSRWRARLRP